jgi:hypothetical protein
VWRLVWANKCGGWWGLVARGGAQVAPENIRKTTTRWPLELLTQCGARYSKVGVCVCVCARHELGLRRTLELAASPPLQCTCSMLLTR